MCVKGVCWSSPLFDVCVKRTHTPRHMLHGVPPPPPVRIHGRDERCPDACAPLFAPLTEEEQQILAAEDLDPSQLLQMLRKLLQKHRTPVRHLFRGLASPDGGLTRRDLHNSLGCLGIKLTPWSCDNLFRALLEYAIEDGEVTLSYPSSTRHCCTTSKVPNASQRSRRTP